MCGNNLGKYLSFLSWFLIWNAFEKEINLKSNFILLDIVCFVEWREERNWFGIFSPDCGFVWYVKEVTVRHMNRKVLMKLFVSSSFLPCICFSFPCVLKLIIRHSGIWHQYVRDNQRVLLWQLLITLSFSHFFMTNLQEFL